jgi:hypothetical protein
MTLELHITLDQSNGNLSVNGMIDNPLIAYGLLEMAKQQIIAYLTAKASDQRIQPATFFPGMKQS